MYNSAIMPGPTDSQELLRQVSRSFYLTLRILPQSINRPISIAYLLARASDTIADTPLIQLSRRREALQQLRKSIQDACEDRTASLPDFGDIEVAQETVAGEGTAGERALLQRFGELLRGLQTMDRRDRTQIVRLLETITCGQENDLVHFGVNPSPAIALKSEVELDQYTYQVAGCVGEFWTEMCRTHLFPNARLDEGTLKENGILFGKGLQLVNILRDLPKDLRRGRCYIPEEQLSLRGLTPESLMEPAAMEAFRPIYTMYLDRAEQYLSAGWQYTLSLPFSCLRVRLACAWPLLIGIRTLQKLRQANVLDDRLRIKISRAEIRQLMLRSVVLYPLPGRWSRLFASMKGSTE